MAKPTNAVKGFIRLTTHHGKEILINLDNIAAVRSTGEHAWVYLLKNPFNSGNSQDLDVLEAYEEVVKRITEAS